MSYKFANAREECGKLIMSLAKKNKKIVHLSPDGSMIENFGKKYPSRYFDLGIAEQNMLGVASGLAIKGKTVIVNSIANFVICNAFLQLRNNICFHNLNVIIIGVGSGLSYGALGFSHHANEDVALLLSLPNMKIYLPADSKEAVDACKHAIKIGGPSYIRLGSREEPVVYEEKNVVYFDKLMFLRKGGKIVILATGIFVSKALTIHDLLKEQNIYADIVNINSLEIINQNLIKQQLKDYSIIISIEEHFVHNGVGSAIQNILGSNITFYKLGIPKKFSEFAGSREELFKYYKLDNLSILKFIVKKYHEYYRK